MSEKTIDNDNAEKNDNDTAETKDNADKIIRNHVIVSMGVGLVPRPILDLVGITHVQLNMLGKLSKGYEIPFSNHKVKNILASLIGGTASIPVARILVSLFKFIPVVGHTMGAVSMPVSAGAITYAVGKVFNQHFASGGTFLTVDPDRVREYYNEMLKEGKRVVAEL